MTSMMPLQAFLEKINEIELQIYDADSSSYPDILANVLHCTHFETPDIYPLGVQEIE
jgi:hypothetical protein